MGNQILTTSFSIKSYDGDGTTALAHAIVVSAAEDYILDGLKFLANYPMPFMAKRFENSKRSKPRSIFSYWFSAAKGDMFSIIKFIHSGWFFLLSGLDSTSFRERLRKKILSPKFIIGSTQQISSAEGETKRKPLRYAWIIGNFEEYTDKSKTAFSMTSTAGYVKNYHDPTAAPIPRQVTFNCTCNDPDRVPKKLHNGDLIAVLGERPGRKYNEVLVLNLTTDLPEKLKEFEWNTIRKLKGECDEQE